MPGLTIQHRVGLQLQTTLLYCTSQVTLHIIYSEVIYNSVLDTVLSVLSSSELSPPQVPDAVWPGLLAPVVPHFRGSPTFIYDVWGPVWGLGYLIRPSVYNCLLYIRSTEANCGHKIP